MFIKKLSDQLVSAQRWSDLFLRVDERSSDSYIGRDDFFSFFRKSSILFRLKLTLHGLAFGFF